METTPDHIYIQTIGDKCAMIGCGKSRDDHLLENNVPDKLVKEWEKPCVLDHETFQTRQFPTPQGVEWAICRGCRVQLEPPANRR